MNGLHYPDNLYADHEERKAQRSQQPTGAYRSTDTGYERIERVRVMPLVSQDLHKRVAKGSKDYGEPLTTYNGRDALWDAYEEALDLCLYLRQAIEERKAPAAQPEPERIPKWDPAWGVPLTERKGYSQGSHTGTTGPIPQNQPPNCDGLSARDVRAPHPMASETLRAADEFGRDHDASGV